VMRLKARLFKIWDTGSDIAAHPGREQTVIEVRG